MAVELKPPLARLAGKLLMTAAALAGAFTVMPAQAQSIPRAGEDPAIRLMREQRAREQQREVEQPPAQISVEHPQDGDRHRGRCGR